MNFTALDLNLLRVFNAMMIELNTTRAGERLGLSQPAVSSALGRLRHITGDELLVRDGNRMVPTPQALALCEPIRSALKQIENALSVNAGFDPATSNQIFRISGADYFSTLLMPALAESVVPVTSGVMLQMLGYPAGEVIDLLSEATIDVALDRPLETPDWICSRVLFRSYLVCVTAKNHPILIRDGIAPGDRIPAQTFCSIPQVIMSMDGGTVGTIDAALKEKGLERRVAMTVPHFQAVALAAANGMLGNMPVHFAQYAARILDLDIFLPPHDPPGMNIMMYWHRRLDRNAANMWLREQIAQAMNFELPSAASLSAP
jgi:DNA-binding transcriptional LysR family regulator